MNIQTKDGWISKTVTTEELIKLLPKERWYEKIIRFFKNIYNVYIIINDIRKEKNDRARKRPRKD
jgi:hypothetical protein